MTRTRPPHHRARPDDRATARRAVWWAVVALAGFVTIASVIDTATADPRSGEGWIGGPLLFVLAGGPLIAVALGMRSPRPGVARATGLAALLLALAAAALLVVQLRDRGETPADRLLQLAASVVYLGVFLVEDQAPRDR
ncbi:MAG: hypothetical protein ACTHMS_01595 [Jatrophihabitans sp.]|uniref:hypothetical protein n=1 Tax=Jatrophihabitans sp. TaxID=1932789 RepID=UPI003F80E558